MIFSRYYSKTLAKLLPAALALSVAGCADDTMPALQGEPGSLTLHIGATGTRADADAVSKGSVAAIDDERTVTSLRYFLFPTGTNGTFQTGTLHSPTPDELGTGVNYTVDGFKPGEYQIVVVANVPEAAGCTSIEELKEVMIDHASKLGTNYKNAYGLYNLPMIAECAKTEISKDKSNQVNAELKFACVKVSYRLLFYGINDKKRDGVTDATRPYGANGFFVNKVTASNLTQESPITLNGADLTSFPTWSDNKEFGIPTYSSDWTDNGVNATDMEDIVPNAATEVTFGGKYIASGVMYLPERYVESADDCTTLTFEGYPVDATAKYAPDGTAPASAGENHKYELKIGHQESDLYQLTRSTYYEIVAEVVDPQSKTLDATVKLAGWTVHNMAGDMSHTTLEVDKTKAEVTSLQTDEIHYTTNASSVTISSVDKYDNKSLVKAERSEGGVLTFRLNPEISYTKFIDGTIPTEGDVKVYVQAGNLRKYIDVHYNASPLFEVNPTDFIIPWNDEDGAAGKLVQNFQYTTNLGGVQLQGVTSGSRYTVDSNGNLKQDNNGELLITVYEDEGTNGTSGRIEVKALAKPSEIMTVKFKVAPKLSGFSHYAEDLSVTIRPPFENYQIYFRAINDNQNDGNFTDKYKDYTNNSNFFFSDSNAGWCEVYYYIYTQMGQTINGNIPASWVWLFTDTFYEHNDDGIHRGGNVATKKFESGQYSGWTRYDLNASMHGQCQEDVNNGTVDPDDYKLPKPGETLIIFNNGYPNGQHRMAFNNQPGIQLFDYEDGEGYYIFDPLCDPYYKVFDSRPEIETVKYTIYSDKEISRWEIIYGEENNQHTLSHNFSSVSGKTAQGKTWYVYTFYAQAPAELYAKAVNVKYNDNGEKTSVLFGGLNYYNPANPGEAEGVFENGKWRMGSVTGLSSTTMRIWFKPDKWTSPKIYFWKNGGDDGGKWPGTSMKQDTDGWYYYDLNKEKWDRCIINNGSDSQKSLDLDISAKTDRYYKESNGSFSEVSSK